MKQLVIFLLVLVSGIILLNLFTAASIIAPADDGFNIPDSVKQIIDRSCFECHNSNSRNKKARKKLEFDMLQNLKTYQVVGKWVNVADVVIKNEMPPRKVIKKHPEKALTYIERQVLTAWVNQLTEQPRQAQITLDSQLENLNSQILSNLDHKKKKKIAILDFSDTLGNVTNFGRYISEELITRLYFTGKTEVVQWEQINNMLIENKLSIRGIIDDTSAVKIGKLLGVDAIAYGIIENEGSKLNVHTQLISLDSNKVLSIASVEIPIDERVSTLLSQSFATKTDVKTTLKKSKSIQPVPLKPPVVEKGGLVFELLNAHLKDSAIVCVLKISNPSENHKNFQMRAWYREEGNTVVYDDSDRAYYISAAKFDNKMVTEMFNVHKTTKTIYAGTSLNLELYFKDDKYTTKMIKKIKVLKIISEIEPWYTAEFKNITLKKN